MDTPFPDPIPEIIPFRTLTIFAGAPAVGKTTMFIEWMHRWSTGRRIWGHPTNKPTKFYYVAADRGQTREEFYERIDPNRVDCEFFSVVTRHSGIDHSNFHKDAHGRELLSHVVGQLQPIPGSHLILDPVAPLFITGNQNRTRDVAASLIGLSRLADELQINITGMWHFSKQKADPNERYRRPQDRIAGSGAVSGFSDTQIYLVDPEPPRQPYHILGWNPRHHPPEEFKCLREEYFVPYTGLDEVGTSPETDRPTQLYILIPEDGSGVAPSDLAATARDSLNISIASFWRDLRELTDRQLIFRDDDGLIHRRKLA